MTIRLAKLPDRTPVRMTIAVPPDLAQKLGDYSRIYERTYGASERPEALIPAILETFLSSDAGFKRARKHLPQTARQGD